METKPPNYLTNIGSSTKKAAKITLDTTVTIVALPFVVAGVMVFGCINSWNKETRRVCGTK